jgi:hypothetical protein
VRWQAQRDTFLDRLFYSLNVSEPHNDQSGVALRLPLHSKGLVSQPEAVTKKLLRVLSHERSHDPSMNEFHDEE